MAVSRCAFVFGGILSACLLFISGLESNGQTTDCNSCPIPCARPQDKSFSVRLTGGRVDPARQFIGVKRDTTLVAGEIVQALRLVYKDGEACKDTVIQVEHVDAFVMGVTLGKVPPLYVPVKPVPEYMRSTDPQPELNYFEIGGFLGYAGKDESTATPEQIGINNFYYGASALVAPFGDMLGQKLSLGIGASALFEGGRLRIPAYGHLRYTFSNTRIENSATFTPSNCQFECAGVESKKVELDSSYERRPGPDSVDPTAALIMERIAVLDTMAPYVFLEGGWIFDGGFEGSGANPSVNPDDYAQYMAGAGVGLPIMPMLHASLGYRFMRLNLRTPCENCDDVFQVNTNIVHSILLRVVLHFGW